MPAVGDCYWLDPDGGTNAHLWVIIGTAPDTPQPGSTCYVFANASSSGPDTCCVLTPADHPSLTGTSYVRYDYVRYIVSTASILRQPGLQRQPMRAAVLRQVQAGAHVSLHTRGRFLQHIPNPKAPSNSTPAPRQPPTRP